MDGCHGITMGCVRRFLERVKLWYVCTAEYWKFSVCMHNMIFPFLITVHDKARVLLKLKLNEPQY
jgi:hypothetical protein